MSALHWDKKVKLANLIFHSAFFLKFAYLTFYFTPYKKFGLSFKTGVGIALHNLAPMLEGEGSILS